MMLGALELKKEIPGYNLDSNCDTDTRRPFAISSRLRIEIFLLPRSTSARKLRSMPTR
jgi:hypothetical protein